MLKSELRQQMRQLKRQFTPQQLSELSFPIISRLKEKIRDANVIMAYDALPDEVNTRELLDDLVAEGKTVLLPKVLDNESMELRRYTGSDSLREGAFHIMEPVGECFTDLQIIDVILIPGIAFDTQGHRLGRGKGYYDRFLSSLIPHFFPLTSYPSPLLIGVCFDFQKVSEVPVDKFDISVNEVI